MSRGWLFVSFFSQFPFSLFLLELKCIWFDGYDNELWMFIDWNVLDGCLYNELMYKWV
jgi:hypothetical protein